MSEMPEILYTILFCTVGDIAFTGIFDMGFYDRSRLSYDPHMHNQYELQTVCEGRYTLENLDGTVSKCLQPDEIALIPPGYYHNAKKESGAIPCKYALRMEFEKVQSTKGCEELYDRFVEKLGEIGEGIFTVSVPDSAENLNGIYRWMGDLASGGEIIAEAYYKLFMTRFVLSVICRDASGDLGLRRSVGYDAAVVRKDMIERFLNANYSNPKLTAQMLAQHVNLSMRQMNRVFSEFYGTSFYQLLTNIRLSHAKKMLLCSQMTVKEIAAQVGYDSTTGLFIAFKKKYGITPGEFRAENKENKKVTIC